MHAEKSHTILYVMGAAKLLVGENLKGSRGGRTWRPTKVLKLEPGLTPGQFSVGYEVEDDAGNKAFLKASDITMALGSTDPVDALLKITSSHAFERNVLERCRGNRLDKIVTAIDSGTHEIVVDNVRDVVFFIVFELAEGDLRKFVSAQHGNDLIWILSAAHNFAVAMAQIHGVDVYHNDFKPGNALVFVETEKMSDLGNATSPDFQAPHDDWFCAGDRRFAPPEQLYHTDNESVQSILFIRAKAGDLYNLGSVIHFLVTKRMITPEIILRLADPFKPPNVSGGWYDSYEGALPYWRQAFDNVMTEFFDDLPDEWNAKYRFALDELFDIVMHLCEPDFRLRGDLKDTPVSYSKYSLEKIVSRLDYVKSRCLVISRGK